jgi:hypothetical protein
MKFIKSTSKSLGRNVLHNTMVRQVAASYEDFADIRHQMQKAKTMCWKPGQGP